MSKRKAGGEKPSRKNDRMDVDDESDGDSGSILNVDFEWFSPEEIDFHGLKLLLRQLFDVDNELIDLSELTNLILSQPHIGSTVKCEGDEEDEKSDPYAFMTVLNLHHHRDSVPAIQRLITYLLSKPGLKELNPLFTPSSKAQVGLILSERFINMPHQVVPPLYTQLQTEIASAAQAAERFNLTHYLIFSKTYIEVASQLDVEGEDDDRRPQKKKSKKGGKDAAAALAPEVFYFHPEDEVLHKFAVEYCDYEYTKAADAGASDAKRAFQEMGVKPMGHMILIEAGNFGEAVRAVGEYLGAQA
ncbi:hypothetical protein LTR62_005876 [Meristemomyces frigidus]|uniref:Protein BCP1 n=1 Tax=Meristemomyces frigidus TaxID=1508187 RepID=A0AAN7TVX2_9PEZI|nr:hypothetical protein LTR62_005876 [Meristemomyces frigidus]